MITIVNYGLGNVQAFSNIFSRLGLEHSIANGPDDFNDTTHLLLPGVGSFDWAIQRLNASNMRPVLDEYVLHRRIPVLGVCVGMQIMADSSEEGSRAGLGWIKGHVRRFSVDTTNNTTPLPHMGWNDISLCEHPLFSGLVDPRFYFLHSYYFQLDSSHNQLATSFYGHKFASCVFRDNIFGSQFHPEKSHHWGLQLLKNFSSL